MNSAVLVIVSSAVFVYLGRGLGSFGANLTGRSEGFRTIYVIDSVDGRLEHASKLGGIPLLNSASTI